ncbi:hypothetical protein [Parasitella parasitica]|uniref:DNA endonuclease activator Ctp1 C-terminal domain-containing protein n=1 Tax=Parasitella parasitica TaxID=35722 RepID=A0A0B7NML3_9FUNG|nr:hypothetical protein [Parasitella parasitica]
MSASSSTVPKDPGKALAIHIQNEPDDVKSSEWKQWELERLRLKCDKDRRTIRGLRISNDRSIEELKTKLQDAISSQERLKEMEIAEYRMKCENSLNEKKQECERLTQSLNACQKTIAFYQLAQTGDKVNEGMKVRIVELEDHIKFKDKEIQELIMQNQAQEKENQELKDRIDSQISEINKLIAMNDASKSKISALPVKCQETIEQIGFAAQSTTRKPRSTPERELNTMSHEQKPSLPVSTSTLIPTNKSPSKNPSTSEPTTAATVQQTAHDAIPLKRALSTSLSDKTNRLSEALKSKKGRKIEVVIKHEQVVIDNTPEVENTPLYKAKPITTTFTTQKASPSTKSGNALPNSTNETSNRAYHSKPQEKPSAASAMPLTVHNHRHRGDRAHMEGSTCISCNNFYDDEVLAANIHGNQLQMTGQDRIQLNSRHRFHRTARSRTPPGFWDLDFDTPDQP